MIRYRPLANSNAVEDAKEYTCGLCTGSQEVTRVKQGMMGIESNTEPDPLVLDLWHLQGMFLSKSAK
jgi:hypothetical protein